MARDAGNFGPDGPHLGPSLARVTSAAAGSGLGGRSREPSTVMVMEYLHQVTKGDKRILVGGAVAGVFIRYPATGSWLCNLNHGGHAEPSQLTIEETTMALTVGQTLASEGIYIAGLDTLTGPGGQRLLSEANTLNPGGFYQADLSRTDGRRTIEVTAVAIAAHLKAEISPSTLGRPT